MIDRNAHARINVKVLITLIVVVVVLGGSLFAVRQIRRNILSKRALAAGEAAWTEKDWTRAARNFGEYLGRHPDDIEILKKYGKALLSVRPLEAIHINRAIGAYRRVIRLDPLDHVAYEKLAMLYTGIGNWEELVYIARMRLSHEPNDPNNLQAPLWLAQALVGLNRGPEARETLAKFAQKLEMRADKHAEYVEACAQMSAIIAAGNSAAANPEALAWLNKAVVYAPDSVAALIHRAQFYREAASRPDVNETQRSNLIGLARKDLESADGLDTKNPRLCLFLAAEWLSLNNLDRAIAELQRTDDVTAEALEESYFDVNDWYAARFLLAAEVAIRQGAAAQGGSLADEVLARLSERRHRVRTLPAAIRLYVAGGRVPEARRCLDEYLDMSPARDKAPGIQTEIAHLQALVAAVEGRPYAVIDALQPVVAMEAARPELWGLLANAYSQTEQTRRAINALTQYLRYRPRDAEAMSRLAAAYMRQRDWNNVVAAARQAEALNPSGLPPKLLRLEANVFQEAQQRPRANPAKLQELSAELADLRRTYPERIDIRILQAAIAERLEQPGEAERELKLAVAECQEPLRVELELARYYYRAKRATEAIQACEISCQNHPEAAEPWLCLAELQAAGAAYETARNCLRQGLNRVVSRAGRQSLSMALALQELGQGDRTAGIRLLQDLAAQNEHEVRARSALLTIREIRDDPATTARLLQELRRAEGENGLLWRVQQASLWLSSPEWFSRQQDIAGYLEYCIRADPGWSAPALLLAQMYERQGDRRRVEDTYRQALVRNPSALDVADGLVIFLERQGRSAEAEQVLQNVQADPRATSDWQVRIALHARDFARAVEELKLRVAGDDQDAESRILLARLLYEQTHDAAQALRYLDEAQATARGATMALTATRVSLLRAEGQTGEAQRVLDDYVSIRGDAGAYMLRAAYLAQDGQWDRAEQDYRKLIAFPGSSTTGYQLLSQLYIRAAQPDKAVAVLEEGVQARAEDLALKRRLMKLLWLRAGTQDQERALDLLSALEQRLPQDPELILLRVRTLLAQPTAQSRAAAKGKLEELVQREPTAADAHLLLIRLALGERQYQTARDYANRALGSNPDHAGLLVASADAELALKNRATAAALVRRALREDPNDHQVLGALVGVTLRTRDENLLQEVRQRLESQLGRRPDDKDVLLWRTRLLVELKSPGTAVPELEAYCRTTDGSRDILALVTLADLYRLVGDLGQSEQWIQQAERLDSNQQPVIHARSLWLIARNRAEELTQVSSAYISAKDQNLSIVLTAASMLSALDSMPLKREGMKLFEHAVRLAPTSLPARLGLATSLYQTGDVEGATQAYRTLLREHPEDPRILNNLAWILQEHYQRYAEALELANKGLDLAPTEPSFLDTRGTILLKMEGRLADARRDFEKLVALLSSDPGRQARALVQLSRICVRLNDAEAARQYLKTVWEIDQKEHVLTADERSEVMQIIQSN